MAFTPFEMMAAAALKEWNIWSRYRKNRSAWFPRGSEGKIELIDKICFPWVEL
jgi:hypothetical protein